MLFFIERIESIIKRDKQKITITQKGNPFQNPASPVLILHAKPKVNIETSNTPKNVVIFSLSFIF